jgi:hypothetical protein
VAADATGIGDAGQGAVTVGRPDGAGTGAAVPGPLAPVRGSAVLGTGTGAGLRPALAGAAVGAALAGPGVPAPVGAAEGAAEAASTVPVPDAEGTPAVCDALADA